MRIKLSSFLAPFVSVFVFVFVFVFATFFSSLSSWGVLVPLELLPLLLEFGVSSFYKMVFRILCFLASLVYLEFGVSNPRGVRLLGDGGEGSLDSEKGLI